MSTPKEDDNNNNGSKFEMFLQRLIKKLDILPVSCEYISYFLWCYLILMILINLRLTPLCMAWIQGLNISSIDPLWIFHEYQRVSFTLALRYLIVCSPYILKLKQEKPKLKVALGEYLIAHTSYSLNEFLSASQIAFPLQHQ
jgi:hypothetical protein